MTEYRVTRMQIWEIVEQAHGGRRVVHATFDDQAEAEARFGEVARAYPVAHASMALGLAGRSVEVFEPLEPAR